MEIKFGNRNFEKLFESGNLKIKSTSHSPPTLQHNDEGPRIRRVADDHIIPTIFEWSRLVLVCVFGVLVAPDMG